MIDDALSENDGGCVTSSFLDDVITYTKVYFDNICIGIRSKVLKEISLQRISMDLSQNHDSQILAIQSYIPRHHLAEPAYTVVIFIKNK